EYQTSTSVESSAGTPSTGWYSENPVRREARPHTPAVNVPSIGAFASIRGMRTVSCPPRPLYTSAAARTLSGRAVSPGDGAGARVLGTYSTALAAKPTN